MVNRPRYLLDTDICIYIKRHSPIQVRRRLDRQPPGTVVMSAVTWGELAYGAHGSRNPDEAMRAMEVLDSRIRVMPLPQGAGEHYGRLRVALERAGTPIGGNDYWIAAHALAEDLILVTNNTREFSRVPDLRIENWVAAG